MILIQRFSVISLSTQHSVFRLRTIAQPGVSIYNVAVNKSPNALICYACDYRSL